MGILGRLGYHGSVSSDSSTRATVVCGAGLLYRKWYNENRYCAAGASYSGFVTGTSPVFCRCEGVFGRGGDHGYVSSVFSARATVVCGAGLLYRPEKQKCSTMLSFCIFASTLFLGTVQCRVLQLLGVVYILLLYNFK